jgi:hypothetical protein
VLQLKKLWGVVCGDLEKAEEEAKLETRRQKLEIGMGRGKETGPTSRPGREKVQLAFPRRGWFATNIYNDSTKVT